VPGRDVDEGVMTKTWKATERAVARIFKGKRTSNQGLGSAVPVVVSDAYCVEVKHREKLPEWLKAAMAQAVTNCRPGLLALVVLHECGQRHDNDLVMVRLADFIEWFGEVPGIER
jgi:hypothetical protein